jgi:ectoine hydroxylase-related dioxygenase (phytanoyl-CoA dioxygenase family)
MLSGVTTWTPEWVYPAHVHRLSPVMTLQGAVAHCDMPIVTGPTMYLPHSQKYAPGYVAFHQPEFTAYFDEHFVQLPLRKGTPPSSTRPSRPAADARTLHNVVAASAEGYAFPTNLDRDQPIDGLAPETQADLVRRP